VQESFGLPLDERWRLDRIVAAGDMIDGHCYLTFPLDMSMIEDVPCSEEWDYRLLNSFSVPSGDTYPGDDYFLAEAVTHCDRRKSIVLRPTVDSWGYHKEVNCVQESFGLPTDQRWRLERIFAAGTEQQGKCYVAGPDDASIEEVPCTDPHGYKVEALLEVPDGAYPGDTALGDRANTDCPLRTENYLLPSEASWRQGQHLIICLSD